VIENGLKNTICTFYEIRVREGDFSSFGNEMMMVDCETDISTTIIFSSFIFFFIEYEMNDHMLFLVINNLEINHLITILKGETKDEDGIKFI